MPKIIAPLSELAVRNLKKKGMHAVGGVSGLVLQISKSGSKSWIFRASVEGKIRHVGLGSFPQVSLKEARRLGHSVKDEISLGNDPIANRLKHKAELRLKNSLKKTFDQCADECISAIEGEWNNSKSAQQWRNTLANYASPVIGPLDVDAVTTEHVHTILAPIWQNKTETASRLRGRLERVLSYSITRGYRINRENPARWKGHLDTIFARPGKVKKPVYHPTLDYSKIGDFLYDLRALDSIAGRALEFLILTATRSGEARKAVWEEIDLSKKLWVIPAVRMKKNKEHVVPLSERAMQILNDIPRIADIEYVFPGSRGGPLSDMTLAKIVKSLHRNAVGENKEGFIDRATNKIATPHGFRSSFRLWAAEQTAYPREVVEHALAHKIEDKSEGAYQRRTLLPKRVKLMQSWSDFLEKLSFHSKSNVQKLYG